MTGGDPKETLAIAVGTVTLAGMSEEAPIIVATGVVYYHPNDERAFFDWLGAMECVASFKGQHRSLAIRLKRFPSDDDLRELLAFAYRYSIDLGQFRRFASPENRAWFFVPGTYWFEGVFGPFSTSDLPA